MKNISAMVHQPQTHTQWPATYPKQLQVSLEVTTIFFFLRCAHKVYTIVMLYRSYSVPPLAGGERPGPAQTWEAQVICRCPRLVSTISGHVSVILDMRNRLLMHF